jgi:hypothetical protein
VENKAKGFVDAWREWQKFEPRVFKDTEISDADLASYSLLLIGGADANSVTARLAPQLPLKVSPDRIVIGGQVFPVSDAAVQMLYPHPRNDQRYVWVFAGTSAAGFNYTAPTPYGTYEWDYVIADGHIPPPMQRAPAERTRVVSGMFDRHWRFDAAYLQKGDVELRARGRRLALPGRDVKVPEAVLDSYAGRYDMRNGRPVEIGRTGARLWAKAGPDTLELDPIDPVTFYGAKFNVWITFEKDASGAVTGFTGHQPGDGDFQAKRL